MVAAAIGAAPPVGGGEPVNERPDWAGIIEEIDDLGANAIRAVRSFLLQAMLHELKVRGWPESPDVPHWQGEVRLQRGQAADEFTPSMRQRGKPPAYSAGL